MSCTQSQGNAQLAESLNSLCTFFQKMFGGSRRVQQRKDLDELYLKLEVSIDPDFPVDETVILNMIYLALKENYGAYAHSQDTRVIALDTNQVHICTSYDTQELLLSSLPFISKYAGVPCRLSILEQSINPTCELNCNTS